MKCQLHVKERGTKTRHKIDFPTREEMDEFVTTVSEKYPKRFKMRKSCKK